MNLGWRAGDTIQHIADSIPMLYCEYDPRSPFPPIFNQNLIHVKSIALRRQSFPSCQVLGIGKTKNTDQYIVSMYSFKNMY